MNWISRIINGDAGEYAHAKLMKYGIGDHVGPRVNLRVSKKSINFKADLDTEDVFLQGYLQGAPEGSHKISGLVTSYGDRTAEFDTLTMPIFWKKSGGKGPKVFKAKIKEVAPLADIRALAELTGPTTFFLLSMSPSDGTKPWKLTTKTSFPKSGTSDVEEGEKEKDPVFTKGALGNTPEVFDYIVDQLIPDFKEKVTDKVKTIRIRQKIIIDDIVPPDDPSLSFTEKRKLAKKKGKLIRTIKIDDEEYSAEYSFFV